MIVGVDVDGVLRDFEKQVRKVYKQVYPSHEIKPFVAWELHRFFPIGEKIYDFIWHQYPDLCLGNAPPLDDYTGNLTRASARGIIAVCMNRMWNQDWNGQRVRTYGEFLKMVRDMSDKIFGWDAGLVEDMLKQLQIKYRELIRHGFGEIRVTVSRESQKILIYATQTYRGTPRRREGFQ